MAHISNYSKPYSAGALPLGLLRKRYALIFFLLLGIEIFIALFVHDRFVRPYLGDVLVVVVLYAFLRILFPVGCPWLPVGVTLFAVLVEVGQAFGLVDRLGLGQIRFFRVLLGSTFDWADLLCYCVGGGAILLTEGLYRFRHDH